MKDDWIHDTRCFSTRGNFAPSPKDSWQCLKILGDVISGSGCYWPRVSKGQGMLLNILQSIGEYYPTTKNYPAPNFKSYPTRSADSSPSSICPVTIPGPRLCHFSLVSLQHPTVRCFYSGQLKFTLQEVVKVKDFKNEASFLPRTFHKTDVFPLPSEKIQPTYHVLQSPESSGFHLLLCPWFLLPASSLSSTCTECLLLWSVVPKVWSLVQQH